MRAVDEAQRVWQAQEVQLRHERDTAMLNATAAEAARSDADARCLLAEAKCNATSEDLESSHAARAALAEQLATAHAERAAAVERARVLQTETFALRDACHEGDAKRSGLEVCGHRPSHPTTCNQSRPYVHGHGRGPFWRVPMATGMRPRPVHISLVSHAYLNRACAPLHAPPAIVGRARGRATLTA